ncbi:unnamed protein product [Lampetra fluviatilis]
MAPRRARRGIVAEAAALGTYHLAADGDLSSARDRGASPGMSARRSMQGAGGGGVRMRLRGGAVAQWSARYAIAHMRPGFLGTLGAVAHNPFA